MTHSPLIVETHGLSKRFGERLALSDVHLTVPRGAVFGLLGHNGAGKTTLIRLLVGLTRPDSGSVLLGGRDLHSHRSDVLARVGALIEEPRFHVHLSGRQNLRLVAAARGSQAVARVESALRQVQLTRRADDRVRTYSTGMRQRLGIARCLLADPELMILDEPMNGLDPMAILDLRALIARMAADGRTVLLSSHLLDEIERTCQSVAIIDRGRLVAVGTISELTGGVSRFDVRCDDPQAAVRLLTGALGAEGVREIEGAVRLTVATSTDIGEINAHLVRAGIAVFGISAVHTSLEERFLQLTSPMRDRP